MDSQKLSTIESLSSYVEELKKTRTKTQIISERLEKITESLARRGENVEIKNLTGAKEVLWKINSYNL